ncbi:dihydropyrimidinase [candidate division KSB1 bacterium]
MAKPESILIKGGTVVLGQSVSKQDIFIEGEKIKAVGDLARKKADEVVDAKGKLVLPGGVDTHVHFDDVFMDTVSVHNYYTGTLAAAYGGTTTVVDFSNQVVGEPLMNTLKSKKKDARGKAVIDYGVHPVITKADPEIIDEIPELITEGAPTIKCYMTYRREGLLMEDDDLKKIALRLRDAGGMLMLHAEDNDMIEEFVENMINSGLRKPRYHAKSRPTEAENVAIARLITIARETNGRLFIVHLASNDGMALINIARSEGLDIIAETCTHYLVFTEQMLERKDGVKWVCSPPLREQWVQMQLWKGLQDGRIAMVTSDDAAYSWEAKQKGAKRFDKCPNGIAGIEPRFIIMFSEGVAKGRLSLPRFVELVSTTPAMLFGMSPQKGTLLPGADADVVILDPKAEWVMNHKTLHMAADYAAYDDIKVTGKITKVFSRGELIIDGEKCLAKKGRGRYLHRKLDLSVRSSI